MRCIMEIVHHTSQSRRPNPFLVLDAAMPAPPGRGIFLQTSSAIQAGVQTLSRIPFLAFLPWVVALDRSKLPMAARRARGVTARGKPPRTH